MNFGHNIHKTSSGNLYAVVDNNEDRAKLLAQKYNAKCYFSAKEALSDEGIDAVIIATTTSSHAQLITDCANGGKHILCEKPIDIDIDKVRTCLNAVERNNVKLLIGFNRRFDIHLSEFCKRIKAGEIGSIEMLSISSKDHALPDISFLKNSGGLFMDMMIHDIDMARWILQEEFLEVYASGSCLIDKKLESIRDIDTGMVIAKTKSGKLCHISNSRRSVFGYDQRIEVFGGKGMLNVSNPLTTTIKKLDHAGSLSDKIYESFPQRYENAYIRQLNHFLIDMIQNNLPPLISGTDSLETVMLANAIHESYETGEVVRLKSF